MSDFFSQLLQFSRASQQGAPLPQMPLSNNYNPSTSLKSGGPGDLLGDQPLNTMAGSGTPQDWNPGQSGKGGGSGGGSGAMPSITSPQTSDGATVGGKGGGVGPEMLLM